jgi:hypothetical protein
MGLTTMPVIHGPRMALVSRGAVCQDRCDSDPLFSDWKPPRVCVSVMKHPMAVTLGASQQQEPATPGRELHPKTRLCSS